MIFAAADSEVGTWVIAGSVVCNFVLTLVTLFRIHAPQKREVTLNQKCAEKDEFKKLVETNDAEHKRIEANLFSKLGGVERGARAEVDKLREDLNERIDAIHETLRTTPNEIITMMRNAGIIK